MELYEGVRRIRGVALWEEVCYLGRGGGDGVLVRAIALRFQKTMPS